MLLANNGSLKMKTPFRCTCCTVAPILSCRYLYKAEPYSNTNNNLLVDCHNT